MINQTLINDCITEINSWSKWPEDNPANNQNIDLSREYALYLFTLKNLYDVGEEKSDLARAIVKELDYWPSAEPYVADEDFSPLEQLELIHNKTIGTTYFTNDSEGWAKLFEEVKDNKLLTSDLLAICWWNDKNGEYIALSRAELRIIIMGLAWENQQ